MSYESILPTKWQGASAQTDKGGAALSGARGGATLRPHSPSQGALQNPEGLWEVI